MIELPLRLRLSEQPQRAAAAWFIAGEDPCAWLEEMSAWQIPLDDLRLYPVPRSPADRRVCGLLVLSRAGRAPVEVKRAEAYGKCGGRLYVPLMAGLDPPAWDAEIEAELTGDLAVWHPGAGLVGFASDEGLSVGDLIEPPIERPAAWDGARPGTAWQPRLVAVLPPEPPPIEKALADWRDDIGSQSPEELPPAPREPIESPLGRLGRAAATASAKLTEMLAQVGLAALGTSAARTLEKWAARQVARRRSALDAARRKEIDRLLHLLESDPDRGLRYALPFTAGGHRGEGTPGSRLPRRDIDFRVDQLGGGRPADLWRIEAGRQLALQRRYRELANREVQLGRHRRAAYIFAELLGDLAAAASALEQGGHDREAAALYRDRLRRPLDAARCLERCGGWDEAIEIYVSQKRFEQAAELLTRLERPDQAAAMYRRAVERWTESGDRLRAAALLESKLAAVDEAVDLLAGSWPAAPQAAACLAELFQLLGRHARHEEARRLLGQLRAEQHGQTGRVVGVLAGVAQKYPSPLARQEAADAARVLAGNRLPSARPEEAGSLVRAVRSLVPQDELLGRDAARWLARLARPSAVRAKLAPPQKQVAVVETGRFRLPADVLYKAAVVVRDGFLAAGYAPRGVAAVRASFSEVVDRVDWEAPLADLHTLLLDAHDDSLEVNIALVGYRGLEFRRLNGPTTETSPIHVYTQPWITPETLAVACSSPGVWWNVDSQLLLTVFRGDGLQISSQQLWLAELGVRFEPREEVPERLAVMLARREDVYLAVGNSLVKVKGCRLEQAALRGWTRRLVAAPLVLHPRLAAAYDDYGAAVIWDDLNGRDVLEIADDLERPELAFTLDGLLVAANGNEGRVYATSNRSVTLRGRFNGPRRPLAAAISGRRPGEFALLTEDGEVRCYRVG